MYVPVTQVKRHYFLDWMTEHREKGALPVSASPDTLELLVHIHASSTPVVLGQVETHGAPSASSSCRVYWSRSNDDVGDVMEQKFATLATKYAAYHATGTDSICVKKRARGPHGSVAQSVDVRARDAPALQTMYGGWRLIAWANVQVSDESVIVVICKRAVTRSVCCLIIFVALGLRLELQPEKDIFLFNTKDAVAEWTSTSDRSIGGKELQYATLDEPQMLWQKRL